MSKRLATAASPSSLHKGLKDTVGKIRSHCACLGGPITQENQVHGAGFSASPIVVVVSNGDG